MWQILATDPELEEAAIRFANGDDAGAEAGLIQALGRGHPDAEVAFNWAAAAHGSLPCHAESRPV